MAKYTLKKKEILSSKKEIDTLFRQGQTLFKYPLKLIYKIKINEQDSLSPVLFSVTVPKRNIRKAVERNLVKRRIREAYRLNKHLLYNKIPEGKQLVMMFIYVGKKPEKYQLIQNAMRYIIEAI